MATVGKVGQKLTLEEFLLLPDEKPYREFIDGRIEVKVSPKCPHALIQGRLVITLDRFAQPMQLGLAFPELRCTFGGRSIVGDVVFQKQENVPRDKRGRILDDILVAPDFLVEIRSPGQTLARLRERIRHALSHGCPLAWLIDPRGEWVEVHRPLLAPVRFLAGGILEGEPTLPGFRLAVSEIFDWLFL